MKMYTLENLSGDSVVKNFKYEYGKITLTYEDYDTDQAFIVEITTDSFYNQMESVHHPLRFNLLEAAAYLPVDEKSGRYLFPAGFEQQMKLSRDGFHLLVGKKSEEWKYLLQLAGYGIPFACPIQSLDCIKITAEEE